MKLLSYIFVLLMLGQSFSPCTDVNASLLNTKTESGFVETSHHQHKSAHDACSPFCQCSCCATPSVTQLQFAISSPAFNYSTCHAARVQENFTDVSLPVWQPPRTIA